MNEEKDTKNELREKIGQLEEKLDIENGKLKKINTVQDSLISLKKSLDKCTAVLSRALEPGDAKEKFNNLLDDNALDFKKTHSSFEEQAEVLKRKVIDLQAERDKAIQDYEEYSREEEKDSEK